MQWAWLAATAGAAVCASAAGLACYRRARRKEYATWVQRRSALICGQAIDLARSDPPAEAATEFGQRRLVRVGDFVTPACLARLRSEAESNLPRMVRSYIPTHKKGATLSYENIYQHAPGCLAFYHSPQVQAFVAKIVGQPVYPTPEQDQSSLSVLCYHEPGDHIQWHFDHNFYRGRHFTVLLSLCNEGREEALSASRLWYKDHAGREVSVDTSANTLVLFEGARVLHKASPTIAGDRRILLSMTYCCDPRIAWWKELARRAKDTAFFGLKALWR